MGKSKKKDPAKKAALQAKKDAKADKSARKRMQKESTKLNAGASQNSDNNNHQGESSTPLGDNNHNRKVPESLDDLLDVYRKRDVEGTKPIVETLPGFPPPRGNFSMTVVEDQKGKQEVYIFGGEYFDGVESIVVDHLLKWSSSGSSSKKASKQGDEQQEWQQIIMPSSVSSPPARCAHSTVFYNGSLYVFGGELATSDYYHHYKDLWQYDIKHQTWSELKPNRTGSVPSSRSGHSSIVWKHYMIVFGGFYEAARDTPRWFNDVFVFDLKTQQWLDIPHSKLGARPEPRSACNVALLKDDAVVIHGGFSKLPSAAAVTGKETKVHTDTWILHLKPILQEKPPTWEKILSSSGGSGRGSVADITNSRNPNGRSAAASCTYKNKMIVFGGVVDAELMHHKVDSVFFNDIFCLDVDPRPKWFPLTVRKNKSTDKPEEKDALGSEQEQDANNSDNDDDDDEVELVADEDGQNGNENGSNQNDGWSVDQLRENMFAFVDGSGNLVYERMENKAKKKILETDSSEEEKEEEEKGEESDDADGEREEEVEDWKRAKSTAVSGPKLKCLSAAMAIDPNSKTPQVVQRNEPLPRIKCGAIVHRNTFFIYGGLVEIGDREVTLDDMWCLDLRKRNQWVCIWPGTMHKQVWRGAVHDDDDSYISTGAGDNDDESDDDSESDGEQEIAKSLIQGAGNAEHIEELDKLTSEYDLANEVRTPKKGEVLADFYSRTKSYWNGEALKVHTGAEAPPQKELKREGFHLARKRFEDLDYVLKRVVEISLVAGHSKTNIKKTKCGD